MTGMKMGACWGYTHGAWGPECNVVQGSAMGHAWHAGGLRGLARMGDVLGEGPERNSTWGGTPRQLWVGTPRQLWGGTTERYTALEGHTRRR